MVKSHTDVEESPGMSGRIRRVKEEIYSHIKGVYGVDLLCCSNDLNFSGRAGCCEDLIARAVLLLD